VSAGRAVALRYFGRPDSSAQQLAATVQAVAADEGAVLGAVLLAFAGVAIALATWRLRRAIVA
jgi:hypothetical protein